MGWRGAPPARLHPRRAPPQLGQGLWVAGLPARALALGLIRLYRATVSPLVGGRCRFHPSCSAYAEEAIRVHGATKGSLLAVWRILRCSPLSAGGPDPVPGVGSWRGREAADVYDSIIHTGPEEA